MYVCMYVCMYGNDTIFSCMRTTTQKFQIKYEICFPWFFRKWKTYNLIMWNQRYIFSGLTLLFKTWSAWQWFLVLKIISPFFMKWKTDQGLLRGDTWVLSVGLSLSVCNMWRVIPRLKRAGYIAKMTCLYRSRNL